MVISRAKNPKLRVSVLAGGVGAARFLRGLLPLLEEKNLTVIVNTTDDESFFGLHVSPDLDTITYTLAGVANRSRGWGLEKETFHALKALGRYYEDTWFQLGDRDLATHIFRTEALRKGKTLTQVTGEITRAFGLQSTILPMSNQPVRTRIRVAGAGTLAFQDYLVKRRATGQVQSIQLAGIGKAKPAPGVLRALRQSDVILIPPSNPFVSILPILRLPGVRAACQQSGAPIAAVSPLIGGAPIKGPLDRMLSGLGHEVSSSAVAALYRGIANLFVLDRRDATEAEAVKRLGMSPLITNTLLNTPARARRLVAHILSELA